MDTKLRKICTNNIVKFIAFILVAVSISIVATNVVYMYYKGLSPESIYIKEYIESNRFERDFISQINAITHILKTGEGEENTNSLKNNLVELNSRNIVDYYIKKGNEVYKSSDEIPETPREVETRFIFYIEKGEWVIRGADGNKFPYTIRNGLSDEYNGYVKYKDEFLKTCQENWINNSKVTSSLMRSIIIFFVLALILVTYLVAITGLKYGENEIHLTIPDRIYTEIQLGIDATVLIFGFIVYRNLIIPRPPNYNLDNVIAHIYSYKLNNLTMDHIYSLAFIAIWTFMIVTVGTILLLSHVRKIKARVFFKHSILYAIIQKVLDFFRALFNGKQINNTYLTKALFIRQRKFIITSFMLVFVFVFFLITVFPLVIIPISLEILLIYWYIKGNNQIYSEINEGFNESLQEQMRSERMKIDLVTNVSHDLKTPLTSIISYVDLLSKEDLSAVARDYVNIIADKSNRLKNMVSDIFELSKSTSGDIKLKLESLDLKKLIEQTIYDMDDEIKNSGQQVKLMLPEEPVMIVADGEKMYRVYQNILDNALKYSLQGTRIFIELKTDGQFAESTVKNIANYEMNFTADEILHRFIRGDKARTSEGSGLGLSIAESFTNVCGGKLKTEIEGDMFKVIIRFKLDKNGEEEELEK